MAPSRHRSLLVSLVALPLLGIAAGAAADTGAGHWIFDHPFFPHRARIGVQVQPMSPELRVHFHAPEDRGLLVNRVEAGRPAEAAGLSVGDVILTASGEPMRQPYDLVRAVGLVESGESIELVVLRGAKQKKIQVAPEGEATPWVDPQRLGAEWLERGRHHGGEELRRRLHDLEQRFEEFERELHEKLAPPKPGGQQT
ncbi:MAG: PDZ domain-containing protein [Proteobacteria bacterium]|nr:PDZ domain-containing protein [Pseudomonadota bacterium]